MSIQMVDGDDHSLDAGEHINVEVIHIQPGSTWRQHLQVASVSTVQTALMLSGFFDHFSDYTLDSLKVGIYGQQCALDRVLHNNDRIEIYRPLVFDPMESRRRRARHRQRQKQSDNMSDTGQEQIRCGANVDTPMLARDFAAAMTVLKNTSP